MGRPPPTSAKLPLLLPLLASLSPPPLTGVLLCGTTALHLHEQVDFLHPQPPRAAAPLMWCAWHLGLAGPACGESPIPILHPLLLLPILFLPLFPILPLRESPRSPGAFQERRHEAYPPAAIFRQRLWPVQLGLIARCAHWEIRLHCLTPRVAR